MASSNSNAAAYPPVDASRPPMDPVIVDESANAQNDDEFDSSKWEKQQTVQDQPPPQQPAPVVHASPAAFGEPVNFQEQERRRQQANYSSRLNGLAKWTRCVRLCALVCASVVTISLLRFCIDVATYASQSDPNSGDLLFILISLFHGLVGAVGIGALLAQKVNVIKAYLGLVCAHYFTYAIALIVIATTNKERMVLWLCFSHTYNTSSQLRCQEYLTLPQFNESSHFASTYTKQVMFLIIIASILAVLCIWSGSSYLKRKAQHAKMVAEQYAYYEEPAVKAAPETEDVEKGSDSDASDDESPAAAKTKADA